MTWFQAFILGVIQGLTEFLPVSSSAHLVLTPFILNWDISPEYVFPFGILVQLGTLIAVILYFKEDLWKIMVAFFRGLWNRRPFDDPSARMGWYLILATAPAAIAGLLITKTVEAAFHSPAATAGFLLVTALLLFAVERWGRPERELSSLTWRDALWIGVLQILALFPGVSRSGATISAGMFRRLNRPSAARFSFLMSIPVMLGAGLLSILDLEAMSGLSAFLPAILVGITTSMVVGYLCIHWLLRHLNRRSLRMFGFYCAILGVAVLIVSYVR